MKINWTVRAKNPLFWAHILMAVLAPVLSYFGLTGADMTTWPLVLETLKAAILNPYVCVLIVISVWNAVNDPTTTGISDSARAMGYTEPWEDK